MAGTGLTDEQKQKILQQAAEAENFLHSELFQNFKTWVDQEKAAIIFDIVYNRRNEDEKSLGRLEFIEERCAYYKALDTPTAVFKQWVTKGADLERLEAEAHES